MSRINSFTETTGFRSPHNSGGCAEVAGGFGEEQAVAARPAIDRATHERATRRARRLDMISWQGRKPEPSWSKRGKIVYSWGLASGVCAQEVIDETFDARRSARSRPRQFVRLSVLVGRRPHARRRHTRQPVRGWAGAAHLVARQH